MIDKKSVAGQYTFDLPEPSIKQYTAPEDYVPYDRRPDAWPTLRGVIGFDVETHDPGLARPKGKQSSSWARPGEGFVTGFSIAWEQGHFYVPLRHAGGNVEDEAKAWAWLRAQLESPDVTLVGANTIYDIGWLLNYDISRLGNAPVDVQGMAALLDEDRPSYSLDSLLRGYLGRTKNEDAMRRWAAERGIVNPKLHMRRMPAWAVDEYGGADAQDALDLYRLLLPQLEEQRLMRVFELERKCLLVGRDLRWRGVRVDQDRAARTKAEFERRRDAAVARIFELTGIHVSPWDNAAIAKALKVEQPDFPFETTSTGQVSIRAAVIDAMGTPVARLVREMRKLDKAITTFFQGYIEDYISSDGRLRAEFHPLRKTNDEDGLEGSSYGTVSGRWSSSGPNLQNIPRRDPEIGPAVRRCFLPEEGERWGKLDYSSQEPRLATHFANLVNLQDPMFFEKKRKNADGQWEPILKRGPLRGAAEMVAKYNANPDLSLHKETARMMGIVREGMTKDEISLGNDRAKAINLGLIYGMQGKRFCQEQGLPTKWIESWRKDGTMIEVAGDEGQALLDMHAAALPWVKDLALVSQIAADHRGYALTILGRRIRFNRLDMNGKRMNTYKALNSSVQGSAADQMKLAQVGFHEAGIYPLVVVHDDANISLAMGEAGDRRLAEAQEIMREAIKLSVPSTSEAKIGDTWGDV